MLLREMRFSASLPMCGFCIKDTGKESWHPDAALQLQEDPSAPRAGIRLKRPDTEHDVLYRNFAEIEDESDVLAFATEWGFLFRPRAGKPHTEPVSLWLMAARDLRHAIRVNELLRSNATSELAAMAKWKQGDRRPGSFGPYDFQESALTGWYFRTAMPSGRGAPKYVSIPFRGPDESQYDFPWHAPADWLWQYVDVPEGNTDTDPRIVADAWLHKRIGSQLIAPQSRRFDFVCHEFTGRSGIQLAPPDLYSLMWFQFARSLAEEAKERACRACGRWFRLVPRDRGARLFCSDACKMRDYRSRKAEAEKPQPRKTKRK